MFSWNFPVKLAEAVDDVYIIWIYPLKFNIDITDTTISLHFSIRSYFFQGLSFWEIRSFQSRIPSFTTWFATLPETKMAFFLWCPERICWLESHPKCVSPHCWWVCLARLVLEYQAILKTFFWGGHRFQILVSKRWLENSNHFWSGCRCYGKWWGIRCCVTRHNGKINPGKSTRIFFVDRKRRKCIGQIEKPQSGLSLGGAFKDFFMFTPKIGEDEPIWTVRIFFNWVGSSTTN